MDEQDKKALELHRQLKGKTALAVKTPIRSRDDLSLVYTPGVAAVSREIAKQTDRVWEYTARGNWVGVVSDGSAVLGLGNIGPEAALPVMEGKAALFKEFADVDALPICLATQEPDEIIETVVRLAPSFGGINLEDISAPRCFYIEDELKKLLDIPVFHDDQHGTAIVVLAGLINAARVTLRDPTELSYVIVGAGAAGVAVTKILVGYGIRRIVVVDSVGIISPERHDLNEVKRTLLSYTNVDEISGSLEDAMRGRDVVIGVSAPGIISEELIRSMNPDPIVFAMANPEPEIMPDRARDAGAAVVATGRSDFPNQINNVLAFPGIFRGVLNARLPAITEPMKMATARALAAYVSEPTTEQIVPSALDKDVVHVVAKAVTRTA